MADGYYKKVVKELGLLGYSKIKGKGKGSHEKWECGETGRIQLVPFGLKSRHTANSILKDCKSQLKL